MVIAIIVVWLLWSIQDICKRGNDFCLCLPFIIPIWIIWAVCLFWLPCCPKFLKNIPKHFPKFHNSQENEVGTENQPSGDEFQADLEEYESNLPEINNENKDDDSEIKGMFHKLRLHLSRFFDAPSPLVCTFTK